MIEIDLTSTEGLNDLKLRIEKEFKFYNFSKKFLSDLLVLMLKTIGEQEIRIEEIENELFMLKHKNH